MVHWPALQSLCGQPFFDQQCRNMLKFTRVLGYNPNLSLGKIKSTRQKAKDKLQEEHDCLMPAFNQVKGIYDKGGTKTEVMGRDVNVMIWIHIITGDSSEHNDLCGHMNGSKALFPVRTCRCLSDVLNDPEAICNCFTVEEVLQAKKQSRLV